MSELFSMALIPLQTFPGWPTAPEPSLLTYLLLLVGLPLLLGVVIGLIALSGALGRTGQGGKVRRKDPVWLGRTAGSSKAITTHADTDEIGGASVRW